ncbi:flagellar assembly protein FliH [Sulfurimonas sp.]
MATVISSDSIERHNVNKYNFKVIALGSKDDKRQEDDETTKNTKDSLQEVDSSALSNSSKESLIESLMKKTDEMSSNFIKLQMKLEQKEEEFKEELKKAKEEAFAEGIEAGEAKAMKEIDNNVSQKISLFEESVKKLDSSADEFKEALADVKSELITAALDIAKEVVKVEISQHSSEIAKVLSQELIKDLQTASKITLKVNPKDHAFISEHLGKLENIDVLSDGAISEGGVVVISDAGNMDAQISKRFERVKKAALSE